MIEALNRIEVISLFVEDLSSAKDFYTNVFGRAFAYQDEVSAVMKIGNLMINLLELTQAHELVAPNAIAGSDGSSPRFMFTIKVEDTDAVCAELAGHGVDLLNGPIDRPWGRRTAAFSDPAGNVWEIAQEINVA